MKKNLLLALLLVLSSVASAQQHAKPPIKEYGILFGLSQPILGGGFNYELNYYTKRFVFDWSHGMGLHIQGSAITGSMKDQKLAAYIPFTLGFGVGYRFTEWLNLRIEPKIHRFRISYAGGIGNESSKVAMYDTYTVGLGLYGKWMPFKNKQTGLKGIIISPSIRYWPNVSTSLLNNKINYLNELTGQEETHQAMNIGFRNTPLFANVSIGYLFLSKKQN